MLKKFKRWIARDLVNEKLQEMDVLKKQLLERNDYEAEYRVVVAEKNCLLEKIKDLKRNGDFAARDRDGWEKSYDELDKRYQDALNDRTKWFSDVGQMRLQIVQLNDVIDDLKKQLEDCKCPKK